MIGILVLIEEALNFLGRILSRWDDLLSILGDFLERIIYRIFPTIDDSAPDADFI